ncbi:nuclear transport factor 2 family protein [Saccharopolyspora sp. TS4A08]|uniref:Nuclear transport factor 2 family protein n=1 Tax=Saccharopolyspora ipomoeae TaxID=3042027 RepID=A0ABT6PID3_9PSEU|nr:nuclear transport factor 2 family protein [Saccharopolyspora sp. TS4A08]MDI2027755.1 nuclear transport factor 2 family protein [Saccharopolyspora sp. TS4A08]
MSGDRGKDLIKAYLDAVGSLSVDDIAPLFHVDGRLDIPYAPEGIPRTLEGRAAIDEFYQALPRMVTPMNFSDYRIWALDEEGEYVAEYRSDSSFKATGAAYRNDYVARVTVRYDGIVRFAEYFDPIPLVQALGGTVTPASEAVADAGPADRGAIEDVLNRYAIAYDENDMSTMADCFTQDAVMSLRVQDGDLIGPFEGRDAIVQLMRDSLATQTDQRRHIVTNAVIRAAGGSAASVESYLTLISVEGKTLTVLSTARYEDQLVRDGGAWRFSKRHVQLDLPY